jgi:hypothetical protein
MSKDMPKVYDIVIQVRARKGRDLGKVTEGKYVFEDGTVTLTDHAGVPATDEKGRKYSHKLEPGENAETIAARLTKQLHDELRVGAPKQGFDGLIDYSHQRGWR